MKQTATRWIAPQQVNIPAGILDLTDGDRLIAGALVKRGINQASIGRGFLNPDSYSPAEAGNLPDLDKAAVRIRKAIEQGERIGIWGDFDVDGQTSTTLFVSALRRLNANVKFHIPVRATESHGINLPTLKNFFTLGIDLLISCDTGISAFDAAQACKEQGIDFIITDHHILPEQLPDVYAVVNPQRLPEGHALSYLCGVGCVYKVIEQVYRYSGCLSETESFLDLVALGTVADIALLKADNRYLVQKGLALIQNSPRPAIQSLLELSNSRHSRFNEEQIGFMIAPRMNALGRLSDANSIVPFLMEEDPQKIQSFALRLENLNGERKMLCDQVFKAAHDILDSNRSLLDDPVIVLAQPEWPTGVVGIVASRLVDLYHRPCILLANPPGEAARGSARSVDGLNITDAIASQKELLLGFGGHAMAAGLALPADNLPAFRRGLIKYIRQFLDILAKPAEIPIDTYLPLSEITPNLVERINTLSPFGAGNPPVILASQDVSIKSMSEIGKTHDHRKLIIEDPSGVTMDVIWWQGAGLPLPEGRFNLAYTVRTNDFKGRPGVQIEWIDGQEIEDHPIVIPNSSLINIEILDYRNVEMTPELLQKILVDDPIVWNEGKKNSMIESFTRAQLTAHPGLVIWNPPPGGQVLKMAINIVKPQKIILLSNPTVTDDGTLMLQELAGMVRFTLHQKGGLFNLPLAAAHLGQREVAIRLGLDWLCAKGAISILEKPTIHDYQLMEPGIPDPSIQEIEKDIKKILQDTAAYRQHYQHCESRYLISSIMSNTYG